MVSIFAFVNELFDEIGLIADDHRIADDRGGKGQARVVLPDFAKHVPALVAVEAVHVDHFKFEIGPREQLCYRFAVAAGTQRIYFDRLFGHIVDISASLRDAGKGTRLSSETMSVAINCLFAVLPAA